MRANSVGQLGAGQGSIPSSGPQQESPALQDVNDCGARVLPPGLECGDGQSFKSEERKDSIASVEGEQSLPRLSIRQIREAAQLAQQSKIDSRNNFLAANPQPAAAKKKKSSLFGGLFAMKEPTQLALNQVAAQMIAQHGSTSPTQVPNVRMERMPEHVPKVNSKWNGLPESKKEREQREKERARAAKRMSLTSTGNSSRTRDGVFGRGVHSRDSSSTHRSSGSARAKSAGSNPSARAKFYAQSVNSSGDLASQQRTQHSYHDKSSSTWSSSRASTSETNFTGVSAAHVDSTFPFRADGTVLSHTESNLTRGPERSGRRVHRNDALILDASPRIDEVPPHSISPATTPPQRSPVTPAPISDEVPLAADNTNTSHGEMTVLSPQPNKSSTPTAREAAPPRPLNHAFLAGEAQELVLPSDDAANSRTRDSTDLPLRNWESSQHASRTSTSKGGAEIGQRPDSSRDRLGLRASMLVQTNVNPWTSQDYDERQPHSPPKHIDARSSATSRLRFSKSFALFNREKG